MIYANCGAIAVITSMTYMTIVELFDEIVLLDTVYSVAEPPVQQ